MDKTIPKYISHIRRNLQGELEYQSNEEHCLGVAKLARMFAREFGMGDFGYAMGMLHDKGKKSMSFRIIFWMQTTFLDTRIGRRQANRMLTWVG